MEPASCASDWSSRDLTCWHSSRAGLDPKRKYARPAYQVLALKLFATVMSASLPFFHPLHTSRNALRASFSGLGLKYLSLHTVTRLILPLRHFHTWRHFWYGPHASSHTRAPTAWFTVLVAADTHVDLSPAHALTSDTFQPVTRGSSPASMYCCAYAPAPWRPPRLFSCMTRLASSAVMAMCQKASSTSFCPAHDDSRFGM
mmetsp:Transcript_17174/g.58726  ORF Transcript_17174/g.58726 Transcript_17174/m.58726 type:complete len:201 (-) Transcript_17174:1411-2013(-)